MSGVKEVYSKEKCEEVTTYVSAKEKIKDPSITEKYYDLVTDFYEFGWGKSFHFAPQTRTEKTKDAMLRHELKIADVLKLKPGMKVLDVGCGVGGPMKNIAEKSGATIIGVNINGYQIKKAEQYMKESGLDKICSFYHGSFMKIDMPSNSIDAIYTIEATVHAPNRVECYKEMYRLLKPGAYFAGYEYALLGNYDEKNPEHVAIIEDMEHGGALQKSISMDAVKQTFIDAGFKVIAFQDDCTSELSWTLPLEKGPRSSKVARALTKVMVRVLETLRIAPKGSTKVSGFLNLGADAFVQAGKRKLLTPNVFFLMQKPFN
jgi:sterol 24-C-methyltransferase